MTNAKTTQADWLKIVDRRRDMRRRRWAALGMGVFLIALWSLAWLAWNRPFEQLFLAVLVVFALALIYAWRTRLAGRTFGFFRLKALNHELRAVRLALDEARLDEAESHLRNAFPLSAHFGAYRASCVALSALLCHFRGESEEGVRRIDAAFDSGWLGMRGMSEIAAVFAQWRVLMLLSLGRIEEAKPQLDSAPLVDSWIPILVAVQEQAWDVALKRADDAMSRKSSGRSAEEQTRVRSIHAHAAALGLFAAIASGAPEEAWREHVEAHPATPLMRINPALAAFL